MILYVSPTGLDSNPGTLYAPTTIAHAKEILRNSSDRPGSVVYFRGGTYTITETIEFTPEDSGSAAGNVTYRSYPGEKVYLSGGLEKKFVFEDVGGDLYRTPIGSTKYRQLYLNGKRLVRARSDEFAIYAYELVYDEFDNPEYVYFSWVSGFYDPAGYKYRKISDRIIIPNTALCSLASDLEMHVRNRYFYNIFRVSNFANDQNPLNGNPLFYSAVKFKEPEATRQIGRFFKRDQDYAFWENSLEFIDYDQWCTQDGYLYVKSFANPNNNTYVVPNLETIISVTGSSNDNPIKYITFYGLDFCYTQWNLPSEEGLFGGADGNGSYETGDIFLHDPQSPPSAIFLDKAHYIEINNCSIYNCGASGISFKKNCSYNSIKNCIVKNTSCLGIEINQQNIFFETGISSYPDSIPYKYKDGREPTDTRDKCLHNVVENCIVSFVGLDNKCSSAILLRFGLYTSIKNNIVHDTPYDGITISNNLTFTKYTFGWNNISNNEIYNTTKVLRDGGAYYQSSNEPGDIISGNYIHDIQVATNSIDWNDNNPGARAGIYLDGVTPGISPDDKKIKVLNNISIPNTTFAWGPKVDKGYVWLFPYWNYLSWSIPNRVILSGAYQTATGHEDIVNAAGVKYAKITNGQTYSSNDDIIKLIIDLSEGESATLTIKDQSFTANVSGGLLYLNGIALSEVDDMITWEIGDITYTATWLDNGSFIIEIISGLIFHMFPLAKEYKIISDALSYAIEESLLIASDMINVYEEIKNNRPIIGENVPQIIQSESLKLNKLFSGPLNKIYIDNIIVKLQNFIIAHYSPINTFLSTFNIKVRFAFADESASLGYPIDADNIED